MPRYVGDPFSMLSGPRRNRLVALKGSSFTLCNSFAVKVTVVGSVCSSVSLSVNAKLTSGAFVCPENDTMYLVGNEGQKVGGFFVKLVHCGDMALSAVYGYPRTAIFIPYGEPHMRKITRYMCDVLKVVLKINLISLQCLRMIQTSIGLATKPLTRICRLPILATSC